MEERERQIWREALQATSLGWDLALPIFGGVLIGYVVDRYLGTTYIFTLGLLLFGVGAGFYNVLRSIQRLDRGGRRRRGGDLEKDETRCGASPR